MGRIRGEKGGKKKGKKVEMKGFMNKWNGEMDSVMTSDKGKLGRTARELQKQCHELKKAPGCRVIQSPDKT